MSAKSEIASEIPRTTEAPRGEGDIYFLINNKQNLSLVIKYSAKTPKFKDLWYLLSQKVKKK